MSPSRGGGGRRRHRLLLAIATVTILHLIVWRSTSTLRTLHSSTLIKRSHHEEESEPEPPSTDALIDWLKIYTQASSRDKPLVFLTMTIWLTFLFAFVGICASEFFCPNLSHIASRLGLSESVAGVTFLAFSNGSPDVFSTFSALKANAGSLAIGELIGAASFIVSVVAGTMALITPFKVARHTFSRDVGFFTLAVLLTLGILFDSHIHLWEALLMVGLYLVYVGYVAIGGVVWRKWRQGRKGKEKKAREEYDHTTSNSRQEEEGLSGGVQDDSDEELERDTIAGGAEIEWERPQPQDSDDENDDENLIHLPVSGTTTPLSQFSTTSSSFKDSSPHPPPPPVLVSPRLPRPHSHRSHSHSHTHTHYRSRSTSLINPPRSSSSRPNPTPLSSLENSITSTSSHPNPLTTTTTTTTTGGGGNSSSNRVTTKSIRPSLLGAIEFRDFVNSLNQERQNASNLLSVFSPSPGGGGSNSSNNKKKGKKVVNGRKRPNHSRGSSTASSFTSTGWGDTSPDLNRDDQEGASEWNWNGWGNNSQPFGGGGGTGRRRASSSPGFRPETGQLRLLDDSEDDNVLADGVLKGRKSTTTTTSSIGSSSEEEEENPWKREPSNSSSRVKKVPSILLNGKDTLLLPSISSDNDTASASSSSSSTVRPTSTTTTSNNNSPLSNSHLPPPSPSTPISSSPSPLQALKLSTQKTHRKRIMTRAILSALFPSLTQFSSKSILGKSTALMCVPALLVLNLTLPVAEEVTEDVDGSGGDLCDTNWEQEEEEEEKNRIPKGIRLPVDGENHDGSSLLRFNEEQEEGEGRGSDSVMERVGKKLHSPAIAHPHSHHLSTSTTHHHHHEDQDRDLLSSSSSLLEGVEEPVVINSPWIDQQQAPTRSSSSTIITPQTEQHHFRISSSSSSSGTVNRVVSTSSTSQDHHQTGEDEEEDELEETESLILDRMECQASRKVTRGLTALQCLLGPIFCAFALFADELKWYQPLIALLIGLFFSTLSWRFFHNPRHPGRVSLCFLGFGIAMVWILMIVNEVVGVLQTLGHIFGISDAILGLTIFAMGNSLGDLVANATVARMGYPSMAIAACFGGPMLNILLGVGLSGTYLIMSSPNHEPIHVEMGRTLMVSGVGLFTILVGSLIVVPLNGFRMTKRIGGFLIGAYTIVLTMNVITEIWW
ncbi:hypothetical protein JCM5350_007592 [Sporobolomyces pararoseus]